MSSFNKSVATAALTFALAGGIVGLAGVANAAPTPATPRASETATPTASSSTSASATPSATPSETTSPSPSESTSPSATPTTSVTPTETPSPTPAAKIKTEFRNDAGAANTQPQYEHLSNSSTTLISFGSLYAEGKPMANKVVAVYDFTGNKRGAQLGAGVTDANGKFRFSAKLPAGWSSNSAFNVQLAYDDPDGVYASAAGVMKPQVSDTPGTPAPSTQPGNNGGSTGSNGTGGLAKTGV